MNLSLLSSVEMKNYTLQQFHSLENGLSKNVYNLNEIGMFIPGSVMVQDLNEQNPSKVTFMNDWGCQKLGHSMEDIHAMGEKYYEKFFVREQILSFRKGITDYFKIQDSTAGYHFFQQVKTGKNEELEWYFTMCKFLRTNQEIPTKLLLISNPVSAANSMVKRLNNIVGQDIFVTKHFSKFSSLTKREKEIIIHLAEGKSTKDISDLLFLSTMTVETHRKNIRKKLEMNSLAELIKFALAFDLVSY